jgi:carboxylesterase type B
MPSAKELFHRAVVLRGASRKSGDKTYSENLGAAVIKEAGLKPDELTKLKAMPWKEFYAIATRAQQAMAAKAGPGTLCSRRANDHQFGSERAIAQLGRFLIGVDHSGAGCGKS